MASIKLRIKRPNQDEHLREWIQPSDQQIKAYLFDLLEENKIQWEDCRAILTLYRLLQPYTTKITYQEKDLVIEWERIES
jgi:hypothetical protein